MQDERPTAFEAALLWAARKHYGQMRHNTGTPYLSHLLATTAIVMEEGQNETVAIAALLHDVLEDTPTTRAELRNKFGESVYRIVDDCTDADLCDRSRYGWHERKVSHLDRMTRFADASLIVIAADKVSSLQSLVDDLYRYGNTVFDDSSRSREDLLWNYKAIQEVVSARLGHRAVVNRLSRLVKHLARG